LAVYRYRQNSTRLRNSVGTITRNRLAAILEEYKYGLS
jgi:hypothetical protein